jgi:hypothetical protein
LNQKINTTLQPWKIYGTDANTSVLYGVVTAISASPNDTEIATAKAVNDLFQQFTTSAIKYKGQIPLESQLPGASSNKNGDYWEVLELDVSKPGHAGHAIWNDSTPKWDIYVDDQRAGDGTTIGLDG